MNLDQLVTLPTAGQKKVSNMTTESFGKFIVISELGKKEAFKYVKANASDVLNVLQSLLKDEYFQRDLYENYLYLLSTADNIQIFDHFKEHIADEMEHALILQKYITLLDGKPTTERHQIPTISTIDDLIITNIKYEDAAVNNYNIAIKAISEIDCIIHASLISDLLLILSKEIEHSKDLKNICQR